MKLLVCQFTSRVDSIPLSLAISTVFLPPAFRLRRTLFFCRSCFPTCPRASSFHQFYGRADDRTRPKRPGILYVDLHKVPDLLHRLLSPEAYQLTHDHTPNLSEEEEQAL